MTKDKPKTKAQRIVGIVLNTLTYLFFAICIIALILTIGSKRSSDGAVSFFGKQMRVVISDSMAECDITKDEISKYDIGSIPIKSMVFIDEVPDDPEEAHEWYSKLEVGDVLTFKYVYITQRTITHRIIAKSENERGGFDIELMGDNRNSEDGASTQYIDTSEPLETATDYVIGKVTGQSYPLGLLISALKEPVGLALMIIVPCLIIMTLEVIRLVNVLTEKKRRAVREKAEKQEAELDALKRQLEALQNAIGSAEPTAEAPKEEGAEEEPKGED